MEIEIEINKSQPDVAVKRGDQKYLLYGILFQFSTDCRLSVVIIASLQRKTHSFIKLLQNICLINTRVTASYETPLILLHFLGIFVHNYCLKYCIFTKLSQIVYLIDVHMLVCQHTKFDSQLWKVLLFNCIFWEFFHILLKLPV